MTPGARFDAIVAGLGAMGSAAAAELARRGARVLGIDAFARGHALGSSHGRTRIIRLAYFEHPDYVPLLRRAWERWRALESESGDELLRETGGIYAGPAGGALVEGALRSAAQHGLAHEHLDAAAAAQRFPALRLAVGDAAVYEDRAGFLFPERCIEAHLGVAKRAGADLRWDEPLVAWSADGDGVRVRTTRGEHRAERLVLTTGAWIGRLLPDLALPLEVERVPLFWFEPRRPDAAPSCIYIVDTPDGNFYGFPYLAGEGVKVARHGSGDITDPDTIDRTPRATDEQRVRAFLRRYLPDVDGALRETTVCMYTNTPDEDFVIDLHPEHQQVVFASACSGHGFKFSSVVGEILADLALTGSTAQPVGFLSAARFARAGR